MGAVGAEVLTPVPPISALPGVSGVSAHPGTP